MLAMAGYVSGSEELVALAMAFLGVGFCVVDTLGFRERKVTALSFFAMSTGLAGVASFVVIVAHNAGETQYLSYGIPQFYPQAMLLAYVGGVLPHAGAWLADGLCRIGRRCTSILPLVLYEPRNPDSTLRMMLAASVLIVLLQTMQLMPSLGSISNTLEMLPLVTVFLLARWGYHLNRQTLKWAALVLAAVLACQGLLFEYLRGKALFPLVTFAMGAVLGKPSPRTLAGPLLLAVYALAALFLSYFQVMGEVRSERVYGRERVARLVDARRQLENSQSGRSWMHVAGRKSSINRQSQVLKLVSDNGFYEGETLSYYAHVFIPRFIWKDKPIVAKGQWFARQLGLGTDLGHKFSNAISMSIPGELYLNFGWWGVSLGCTGIGFLVMLMWRASCFWSSPANLTGIVLSFHLIQRCVQEFGPDMQSVVGYVNTYLLCLALTWAANTIFPNRLIPVMYGPQPRETWGGH